jgi:hypothetical protein
MARSTDSAGTERRLALHAVAKGHPDPEGFTFIALDEDGNRLFKPLDGGATALLALAAAECAKALGQRAGQEIGDAIFGKPGSNFQAAVSNRLDELNRKLDRILEILEKFDEKIDAGTARSRIRTYKSDVDAAVTSLRLFMRQAHWPPLQDFLDARGDVKVASQALQKLFRDEGDSQFDYPFVAEAVTMSVALLCRWLDSGRDVSYLEGLKQWILEQGKYVDDWMSRTSATSFPNMQADLPTELSRATQWSNSWAQHDEHLLFWLHGDFRAADDSWNRDYWVPYYYNKKKAGRSQEEWQNDDSGHYSMASAIQASEDEPPTKARANVMPSWPSTRMRPSFVGWEVQYFRSSSGQEAGLNLNAIRSLRRQFVVTQQQATQLVRSGQEAIDVVNEGAACCEHLQQAVDKVRHFVPPKAKAEI